MNGERWVNRYRPGFFGRRRDEIVEGLNKDYGTDGWRLRHLLLPETEGFNFLSACTELYEASYLLHLQERPDVLSTITLYGEVYDNDPSNVQCGCDYTKQEAYSTHIQDIAIRNVLRRLGRKFEGPRTSLLQVRGPDSVGFSLGLNPGQVRFFAPDRIMQPSLRPKWAGVGSVEDFWQSNKWLQVKMGAQDAHAG